jgi:hypothetical protein
MKCTPEAEPQLQKYRTAQTLSEYWNKNSENQILPILVYLHISKILYGYVSFEIHYSLPDIYLTRNNCKHVLFAWLFVCF